MRTPGLLATVVVAVSAAVAFTPASVSAGEIDNDGEADTFVFFNCGVGCGWYPSIKAGGSVAVKGDGAAHAGFPVNAVDRKSPWKCEYSTSWVPVSADGEVGVTYESPKKDADTGKVVPGTEQFIWVSKSGYDQDFRVAHDVQTMGGDGSYCWGGHW